MGCLDSVSSSGTASPSPGAEEEVHFESVLLGVQVPVAAMFREESFMCAALDNSAGFDYENLVGAPDR